MNDASKHNGSVSAKAPQTGHNNYANLSESEFLVHEAELAKTALGNTLTELKADFAKAGNIKLWAHHYPWLTAGLAVATGFTLAAIAQGGADKSSQDGSLSPTEEAERQRLLRETAKAPYNTREKDQPKLGESLLGSLFSLARTALEASLVTAIHEQGMQAQTPTNPQYAGAPSGKGERPAEVPRT